METLNPTLWLADQEVQIELNRIAEQSKMKITMKPSELADFALTRQVAQDGRKLKFQISTAHCGLAQNTSAVRWRCTFARAAYPA